MKREDVWPLGATGFIMAVTAAWWALALWAVPDAPEWLERTRSVCFNLTETGLPDTKGWLLLLGQPPTMLAFLLVGWGDDVRRSWRRLLAVPAGRFAALVAVTLLFAGGVGAVAKVRAARIPAFTTGIDEPAPSTYPRLDRVWPATPGLVDQTGASFSLERLGGRAAFVTFAFGHCATICPAVVHQARAARLEVDRDIAIVVLTLDPWRDTPSTLPSLLDQFMLTPGRDFLVSGDVDAVNAVLDAWGMPRERDERTGDITHPGIVYLVEPDGTVAYGVTGGPIQMASLAQRLN